MPSPTTVGVDDDFAPGEAGITLRSPNHEPSRRVDQVLSGIIDELGRKGGLDDFGNDKVANRVVVSVRGMLGGHHDVFDPDHPPVFVPEGDL